MTFVPTPGCWADDYPFDERGRPLVASKASRQLVGELAGGFCHAFALALNERYGWELRGLGTPEDEYSINPWKGLSHVPRHVYCLRGDGFPVDVHGLFADEVAIERFFAHQGALEEELVSVPLAPDDVRALSERGFPPIGARERAYCLEAAQYLALDAISSPLAPRGPRLRLSPLAELPTSAEIEAAIEPLRPER